MKSVRRHCSLRYTYRRNCSSTTKIISTATKQEGWPTTNSPRKTVTQLRPTWTGKVSTKCSSRLVTGSGRNTDDHVTRYFADTCCRRQEIPVSHWCRGSWINVTFLLPTPTPPNPVPGGARATTYWLLTLTIGVAFRPTTSRTRYTERRVGHLVVSFGATKPQVHPEDEEGNSSRNVGKPSQPDAAVCPIKFRWMWFIYSHFK
jgi:hypothetical protein